MKINLEAIFFHSLQQFVFRIFGCIDIIRIIKKKKDKIIK